jgi:hypothetical protein
VYETVVSPAFKEGPDALFLCKSRLNIKGQDLVTVTESLKTHVQDSASTGRALAVAQDDVDSNFTTVEFSGIATGTPSHAEALSVVKAAVTEKTMLFLQVCVCLPRAGSSYDRFTLDDGSKRVLTVYVDARTFVTALLKHDAHSKLACSVRDLFVDVK